MKKVNSVIFITHANVEIDPKISVTRWGLSQKGMDRHYEFNSDPIIKRVSSIYSSMEQKSIDAASILAEHLNIEYKTIETLGENDRTSTGYLKEEEFQRTANEFFAKPEISIRGWEPAIDAQKRIVRTIKDIIEKDNTKGDIAIVSHGAVGALLLTYLLKENISRTFDQPLNGGGNYFTFDKQKLTVLNKWKSISMET